MDEVIVIEDRVDMRCLRHLHLMSNSELNAETLAKYRAPNGVMTQEARVWHLRAVHPFRGPLEIECEGWIRPRRLMVWSLDGYPSVKTALFDAREEFYRLAGGKPGFAFMRRLPKGVENACEIGEMVLLETEWMLEGCVAVGGWSMDGMIGIPIDQEQRFISVEV